MGIFEYNEIKGGNIAIYTKILYNSETNVISATGMGCGPSKGLGCGFYGNPQW